MREGRCTYFGKLVSTLARYVLSMQQSKDGNLLWQQLLQLLWMYHISGSFRVLLLILQQKACPYVFQNRNGTNAFFNWEIYSKYVFEVCVFSTQTITSAAILHFILI